MANFEHAEDDPKHMKMSGDVSTEGGTDSAAAASSLANKEADAVPCYIPSFAAAAELLSAPYSCLVMNTHRRHISLPPMYLNKKKTGIQEELKAELLKFSQSLQGVPLAYDNIRVVGQYGAIYDDSGYIHMDIVANFIVFQPATGQKLLGRVNKLGVSHVGCLVHGCFNASIPKPNLVSMETWRDAGPRIGTELEFEVTALDADAVGVLLIRGRLERTRVQELLAKGETSESSTAIDQPEPLTQQENPELNPEPKEESPVNTPKKKKKKKVKDEEIEKVTSSCQMAISTTPEPNGAVSEDNSNGAVEERKKKKKKKEKEKQLKEEEEEFEVSPMEVHGSDSSGYLSDKPRKKRKHETETNFTSSVSEDLEPAKPKKKRKSEKDCLISDKKK